MSVNITHYSDFQTVLSTRLQVMGRSEIADWQRHLAKPGEASDGDILCVLHKSVDQPDFRIRTRPCVRVVQMRNGAAQVVPLEDLQREDRGAVEARGAIALGRRKSLSSFRYIATRYNGNRMLRREIPGAMHCVLPGAVITFQDLPSQHLLFRHGETRRIREAHRPGLQDHAAKLTWEVAVNPAHSRHELLGQVATIEEAWCRFRQIWKAILPPQCNSDLGPAPIPDLTWPSLS